MTNLGLEKMFIRSCYSPPPASFGSRDGRGSLPTNERLGFVATDQSEAWKESRRAGSDQAEPLPSVVT